MLCIQHSTEGYPSENKNIQATHPISIFIIVFMRVTVNTGRQKKSNYFQINVIY